MLLNIYYRTMNIVLTCVGNFQDYILDNIRQLIRLNHENIYVITNSELFETTVIDEADAPVFLM
jgi:hypothetical protein